MEEILRKFTQAEIEEYLFELRQVKYSAEKQLAEKRKLLEETLGHLQLFEERLSKADDLVAIADWQDAIQNSTELREEFEQRIATLEESLDTINQVILRFSS